MRTRFMRPLIGGMLAIALAACGAAAADTTDPTDPGQPTTSPPAAGMCLEGVEDCVDVVVDDDGSLPDDTDAAVDEAALIAAAEDLLGLAEDRALAADGQVRLGRRGEEFMMLTEDYVIGRRTIETEDDGSGTFVVVAVVLELTDGPVTVTAAG